MRSANLRLLFVAAVAGYFPSFYANAWGVARADWLQGFQRGSECHVLGRLVKSRQDGVFSAGGLLGVGAGRFEGGAAGIRFRRGELASGLHLRAPTQEWPAGEQIDEQYDAYLQGGRFLIYSPYPSQIGGQGIMFGLLDKALPLAAHRKLELFRGATALLSAAALAGLTAWFGRERGVGTALCVLASGLLSHWLVGFSRNLWWGLWAFYLPFLAIGLVEGRAWPDARRRHKALAAAACAAVLVKCFVNGYEYVTTALVMAAVPSVHAALKEGAGAKALLARLGALWAGASCAVALSLVVLVGQLASLRDGQLGFGARHVAFALSARTAGAPQDFAPAYAAGMTASRLSVLATYFNGSYVDLGGLSLRYGWIVLAFAAASASLARARAERALLGAAWFSLLAPLSWFVIFKAHSYDHAHMNFVVWQMPFTFFAFAVIWSAAARLATASRRRRPSTDRP